MNITVQKRDGRSVAYDRSRIVRAISLAMNECQCLNSELAEKLGTEIEAQLSIKDNWSVDEIQNLVENKLMASNMPTVAKSYIIYRNKRDQARKSSSNQVIDDIIAAKKTDVTRENANMNSDSPAGMMMKIASERSKEYVDEVLLSQESLKAVKDNILHVHDKDYYPSRSETCIQSPIDKILSAGFVAGHGESRGAKRIETASILAAVSLQTTQNEQHGGQAIPAFDFYMAPYVRKTYEEELDKLSDFVNSATIAALKGEAVKEYAIVDTVGLSGYKLARQHAINATVNRVHQSMEAFVHNMNTIHSRGGRVSMIASLYGNI